MWDMRSSLLELKLHLFDVVLGQNVLVCNNKVDYGVIARDEDGFVLGGGGGLNEIPISMEEAKCYTFEESIKLACRLNIKSDVIFETDNACLVNKLKSHHTYIMINDTRIKECKKAFVNFKLADLVWTNCSCNMVTDFVRKCVRRLDLDFLTWTIPRISMML
ncbi:hypothetical protein Gogos_021316 [Gossypium gossypioides]|uniref:RNase H type-1 domain-containing protein n=1 Tax=Gossypium gossypioides TaxID=34282 RepID=A0A7J9D5Y0_GOSGO|nr:hypothetical protein [Gossypium gossypioides]